jgi:hypothetical protein
MANAFVSACMIYTAAERGAHLRGGWQAGGLTAAAAGEAAWFGGAKRVAEPGCERSERRVLADARSVSARTPRITCWYGAQRNTSQVHPIVRPP